MTNSVAHTVDRSETYGVRLGGVLFELGTGLVIVVGLAFVAIIATVGVIQFLSRGGFLVWLLQGCLIVLLGASFVVLGIIVCVTGRTCLTQSRLLAARLTANGRGLCAVRRGETRPLIRWRDAESLVRGSDFYRIHYGRHGRLLLTKRMFNQDDFRRIGELLTTHIGGDSASRRA